MKYIKLFETHQEYEDYINDKENLVLPNVSFCEDTPNEVHYNSIETRLVVYYDIQDISSPTAIFTNNDNSVKSIEIDGSETVSEFAQGNVNYQFDKVGEHVVKYEFNDPTTIGKNAPLFGGIVTIKQVEIPSTFTSIGSSAFNFCRSLTSIEIPNSVTTIGYYAFHDCPSLSSVTIGDRVTSIGQDAFSSCVGLTNVTIGSGVTNIGDGAFSGTSLTSIEIPNSVTTIGNTAFLLCSSLTNVTIGSGVTSIGGGAFSSCSSLTSVTVEATTPPTLGGGAFGNNASGRKIYVPSGSVDAYKAASNWSTYASDIEAKP